jgi:hypothetical protein
MHVTLIRKSDKLSKIQVVCSAMMIIQNFMGNGQSVFQTELRFTYMQYVNPKYNRGYSFYILIYSHSPPTSTKVMNETSNIFTS